MRVLTQNLWGMGGSWPDRRAALKEGLRAMRPDLIAFQEAVLDGEHDTARDLAGEGMHVVHQAAGLLDDGNCIAIASRWPVVDVREVGLHVSDRTADFPATTLIAEVAVPLPVGPLLFVNHIPSWKPELEYEREVQTAAAARCVEEIVARRPMHVVLAGDLDAVPEAASLRFLLGLQSLGDTSVRYRDAWATVHPGEDGHTFTPRNPLVMEHMDMRVEEGRRIDYVLVRCDQRGPTLRVDACELAFSEPAGGVWASDHYGVVADLVPFDARPVTSP
ncbi:MAG: hypothetical protein QOJ21_1529 [Solirubrobacteraceae bacterium]|nr:hypothetical protein [Solirubrobacteraceae bacterium]